MIYGFRGTGDDGREDVAVRSQSRYLSNHIFSCRREAERELKVEKD